MIGGDSKNKKKMKTWGNMERESKNQRKKKKKKKKQLQ